MSSLIDDGIPLEVLHIVRCGDLEDDTCMQCNQDFARDHDGNVLRGRSKRIKVKHLTAENDLFSSRWQHLECWNSNNRIINTLFRQEDDPFVVLSAFQNALTPHQNITPDSHGNSNKPFLEGWQEFDCRDRLIILNHIFTQNFHPLQPFQLTLQHITVIVPCCNCGHCQHQSNHEKEETLTKPNDVPPVKAAVNKPTGTSKAQQERRKHAALNRTSQELAALKAKKAEATRVRRKRIRDSQTPEDLVASKKNAAASEKARLQNKAPAELVALRAKRAEVTRARRKRIRDSQTAGDLVASKKTAAASEKARQKQLE